MVLSIHTENASNLTTEALRYVSGRTGGQTDRQKGGQTADTKTISLRLHRGDQY